jgi:HD superfamily phosphodiesterase
LIRDTTTPLIYHHSRRVFLFGALQSRSLGIEPDLELLYVAALFHDTGLVRPYRGTAQRFELDSADAAKSFFTTSGFSAAEADMVWTAIALHTTPEVP